jgi:hypothetical protein
MIPPARRAASFDALIDNYTPRRAAVVSRTVARMRSKTSLSSLLLILAASVAHSDAIQPTYTVTDLGMRASQPVSNPGANGVVIAADGKAAYAFPQTVTGTSLSYPYPAGFPVPEAAPPTYGSSYPNSGSAMNVATYPNGLTVAIDAVVQNDGGTSWQRYDPYYVQRNPDGSWGQPVLLAQGNSHYGSPTGGSPGVQFWVDKSGDVLIGVQNDFSPLQSTYTLYNVNTKSSTDISSLPVLANNGFSNLHVLAMDDSGRILAWASRQTSNGFLTDNLLLTPPGVSSDPIAMNAPEPGSLAVMALAAAAYAAYRARKRL